MAHHGDKVKRKAIVVQPGSNQQNPENLGNVRVVLHGTEEAEMTVDGQTETSVDGHAETSIDEQSEMSADQMEDQYDLCGVTCMIVIFCLSHLHCWSMFEFKIIDLHSFCFGMLEFQRFKYLFSL